MALKAITHDFLIAANKSFPCVTTLPGIGADSPRSELTLVWLTQDCVESLGPTQTCQMDFGSRGWGLVWGDSNQCLHKPSGAAHFNFRTTAV